MELLRIIINWTEDKIKKLVAELEEYNINMREDFEKREEKFLNEKWNDLKCKNINMKDIGCSYYE